MCTISTSKRQVKRRTFQVETARFSCNSRNIFRPFVSFPRAIPNKKPRRCTSRTLDGKHVFRGARVKFVVVVNTSAQHAFRSRWTLFISVTRWNFAAVNLYASHTRTLDRGGGTCLLITCAWFEYVESGSPLCGRTFPCQSLKVRAYVHPRVVFVAMKHRQTLLIM